MTTFLAATPRFPVHDLPKTVDFYVDLLGFKAGFWPCETPTFALLERDRVNLQFYVPEPSAPEPAGHGMLYLQVSDVRELHGRLESRLEIEWGPEVYSYGRREFAVRDPSGYLVIFTEETDDPPTCIVD